MRQGTRKWSTLVLAGPLLVTVIAGLAYLLTTEQFASVPDRESRRDTGAASTADAPTGAEHPRSTLVGLDPALIPSDERFTWQPKDLVAVIGHHRQRHWDMIYEVAYSPDGKILASRDGVGIHKWDAASMRQVALLRDEANGDGRCAISPNWSLMAFYEAGALIIRDLRANPPRPWAKIQLTGTDAPNEPFNLKFSFSADSKVLAMANFLEKKVFLFDLAAPQPRLVRTVTQPDKIWSVALSGDGRQLAVVTREELPRDAETILVWDLSAAVNRLVTSERIEPSAISGMLFTANNKFLIVSAGRSLSSPLVGVKSMPGEVRYWRFGSETFGDCDDLVDKSDVEYGHPICSLSLTPDGSVLASADSSGYVHVWDIISDKPKLRMVFRAYKWNSIFGPKISLSPDGKRLATVSLKPDDRSIQIWDIGRTQPNLFFQDLFRDDWFYDGKLQFSPDSRTLATYRYKWSRGKSGPPGEICLWDLTDKIPRSRAVLSLSQLDVNKDEVEPSPSMWFSADQRRLAVLRSREAGDVIQFWNIAAGSEARYVGHQEAPSGIRRGKLDYTSEFADFAYNPHSDLAVVTTILDRQKPKMNEHFLHLWDVSQPQPVELDRAQYPYPLETLDLSQKGDLIASADTGGTLRLWRVIGSKLKFLDGIQCEWIFTKGNVPEAPIPKPSMLSLLWHTPAVDHPDKNDVSTPPQLAACFGPDGRLWLAELFWQRFERRFRLRCWDLTESTASLKDRPVHDSCLTVASEIKGSWSRFRIAVRPQGDLFLRVDETFLLIDLTTGNTKYHYSPPGPISDAALSPNGRYLATANGNGTIYILSLPL